MCHQILVISGAPPFLHAFKLTIRMKATRPFLNKQAHIMVSARGKSIQQCTQLDIHANPFCPEWPVHKILRYFLRFFNALEKSNVRLVRFSPENLHKSSLIPMPMKVRGQRRADIQGRQYRRFAYPKRREFSLKPIWHIRTVPPFPFAGAEKEDNHVIQP